MPARIAAHLLGAAVLFTILFALVECGVLPRVQDSDVIVFVGFYSMVGFIFSVVSAFVIQTKWHVWDRLVEASHGEINAVRQLHLLVRHLPLRLHGQVREHMKTYLESIMMGWQQKESTAVSLVDLEDAIYCLEDVSKSGRSALLGYDLLSKIMHFKEQRENYSRRRTPSMLRIFLFSAVIVIACMSVFLPVVDIWLKYICALSIVLLAYTMYLMIDDLDHPYRDGGWYLSDNEYKKLLEEIRAYS